MALLPHKSNLETKIKLNYGGQNHFFQTFYNEVYLSWHTRNMELTNTRRQDIFNRVEWLIEYLREVDNINFGGRPRGKKEGWITHQSKFRPTVLEEFTYYLLKDCSSINRLQLEFRNKGIFAGLSINSKGNIIIKTKDVDCAIVKEAKIGIAEEKKRIVVPVVAVEVKTYIDKTMWGETQFTAQLIKQGNPSSRVYLLAETNQIKIEELSSNSSVDEVFILKESVQSEIDRNTVYDLFLEIKKTLKQIERPDSRHSPGRLLHPL